METEYPAEEPLAFAKTSGERALSYARAVAMGRDGDDLPDPNMRLRQ